MKIQAKLFMTIAAALCLFYIDCTVKVYDTNILLNDYITDGFLDCDHYQVIIKGFPDKKSRGLVHRRESALRDARSKMNEIIIESLSNYYINYQLKELKIKDAENILNLSEAKDELAKELGEYLEFGYNAFEYYNEDNSAVIVYRIYNNGLIDCINSIDVKFILKMDE